MSELLPRSLVKSLLPVLLAGLAGCRPTAPPPSGQAVSAAVVDLFQDDRGRLVQETWDAHFVRGAKVGHRQLRVYELPDAHPPLLRIVAVDRLELKRFGEVTKQELTTISLETPAGQILQLAYRLTGGDALSPALGIERAEGVVRDGQLLLTRSRGTTSQSRQYVWPPTNQGFFAVERSLQRQPMTPGQQRQVEAFSPLSDRPVRIELRAVDRQETSLNDRQRRLLRIEAYNTLTPGWEAPTTYWTDEHGQILKTQEALLNRQTLRVSQQEATRLNDLVQLDLGIDVEVPANQPIDDPYSKTYAVYRVHLESLRPEEVFPSSLSQRLISSGGQFALLTVSQVLPDQPAVLEVPQEGPQPNDLSPNRLIQSDDPRVMAIADAAAGSVADPWRGALALEQYLYRTLGKADFSQIFSSAAEVAARRKGDCSEHAVLLAATCRARKIPARVAIGLLYVGEHQGFLYHMWNEVWIKDRWIPLDATLGRGGVGATHLTLRTSSLAGESPYSLVTPMIYLIDQLKIEIVEVR